MHRESGVDDPPPISALVKRLSFRDRLVYEIDEEEGELRGGERGLRDCGVS